LVNVQWDDFKKNSILMSIRNITSETLVRVTSNQMLILHKTRTLIEHNYILLTECKKNVVTDEVMTFLAPIILVGLNNWLIDT
jgi:hypothetical protein